MAIISTDREQGLLLFDLEIRVYMHPSYNSNFVRFGQFSSFCQKYIDIDACAGPSNPIKKLPKSNKKAPKFFSVKGENNSCFWK